MNSNTTTDFLVASWTQCPICDEFISQEYMDQHVVDHEIDGPNVWRCFYPDCRRVFKNRMVLHQHQGKMHKRAFTW